MNRSVDPLTNVDLTAQQDEAITFEQEVIAIKQEGIVVKQEADTETVPENTVPAIDNNSFHEIFIKEEVDSEDFQDDLKVELKNVIYGIFSDEVDYSDGYDTVNQVINDGSNATDEILLLCNRCPRTISKRNMKKHMEIHDNEHRNYIQKLIDNEKGLKLSRNSRSKEKRTGQRAPAPMKDINELVSCKICHRFISNQNMEIHLMATHADHEFYLLNKKNTKMTKPPEGREDEVFCGICNDFIKRQYKREHFRIHLTDTQRIPCRYCALSFTEERDLKTHFKTHKIRPSGNKVQCPVCGERFIRGNQYKLHVLQHTTEKAFKCPHCDSSFLRRNVLNNHLKSHNNDNIPFECSSCSQKFCSKTRLINHLKTHTQDDPYSCSVCGLSFSQKYEIQRHTTLFHMNYKPSFSCHLCNQSFSREEYLKEHILTHGKVKRF